ncbi:jerky [Penicillium cf. griseofulvum]|nr:jerky [Penicillium cf. griseofulvum]
MPRRAIPTSEKIALREYRRNNILLSNKQLAQWFEQTYNHRLSPSTISEILSSRYRHLDAELSKHQISAKRTRIAKWPELEKALIHWVKLAENHIPITQEVIREKARFFWRQLPIYEGIPMPSFSNGWLAGFQHRESIQNRVHYREDGSTPESASEAMIPIRQALQLYSPRDIFNCDETGLY